MSTFNTERLKQLVGYAIKGAGFDKLLELSRYIGITVSDGMLYLNTTNGTNFLNVSDSCEADDMDIVVDAELFSKLINKINSDTVDLEVVNNTLFVKGNGKYTLEIIPNEAGEPLSFPDKFPENTQEIGKLTVADLSVVNTSIKASLSDNVGSVYSNYYFGDIITSTDRCMASIFNRKVFDKPYIFNREFIDLMILSGADVTISQANDVIMAESALSEKCSIAVCTKVNIGANDFNIDGINKFAALDATSFCRVRKAELLDLLDRLSLFVNKFDDGAINLVFKNDGIEITSLASNGIEKIEFVESKDAKEISIKINIDRFSKQLKAYSSDMVDLYYGSDVCIKLIDGDVSQIIALMKTTK